MRSADLWRWARPRSTFSRGVRVSVRGPSAARQHASDVVVTLHHRYVVHEGLVVAGALIRIVQPGPASLRLVDRCRPLLRRFRLGAYGREAPIIWRSPRASH